MRPARFSLACHSLVLRSRHRPHRAPICGLIPQTPALARVLSAGRPRSLVSTVTTRTSDQGRTHTVADFSYVLRHAANYSHLCTRTVSSVLLSFSLCPHAQRIHSVSHSVATPQYSRPHTAPRTNTRPHCTGPRPRSTESRPRTSLCGVHTPRVVLCSLFSVLAAHTTAGLSVLVVSRAAAAD